MRTRATAFLIVIAAAFAFVPPAAAQGYPTRPIRLVVPYPAGGSTDVAARIVGAELSKSLAQSVVIENKPGASGTIGAAFVAKSEPDGYTLLFGSATDIATARATINNVPYDSLKDFEPITLVGTVPFLLITNPSVPANNLSEFMAWLRTSGRSVNYSTFGRGTTNHMAGEAFKFAAGVDALAVPYKGSAPSMTGLIAGDVQFTFDSVTAALPQVRGNRVKAIAITSADRLALVPGVPTMSESGLPGFSAGTWWGIVAPRNTPAPIVAKLHAAVVAVLRADDVRARFTDLGAQLVGNSPQEFAQFISIEGERATTLATRIGLVPE